MQIGTFRKNVMKTVGTKAAKLGLRTLAKNTLRTNIANSTVALNENVGHLLQALNPYIVGFQMTDEMRNAAFNVFGDIGYDLTVLCRSLKVKMPAATKKSKLVGTPTAALLALDHLTTTMLGIVREGAFTNPVMKTITKTVVLPNKGGAKEERQVSIVDVEANTIDIEKQHESLRQVLSGVVDVFWRLSFDLLKEPPAAALQAKFERLQKENPDVIFDLTEKKADATTTTENKAHKAPKTKKKVASAGKTKDTQEAAVPA